MPPDDLARLEHMVHAAEQIIRATEDRSRTHLDEDWIFAMGLIKGFEVIGEAAARVSPACQHRHPLLPWSDMVGMRNRLVHGYFDIDLNIVWQTATVEVPDLVRRLREAVKIEQQ